MPHIFLGRHWARQIASTPCSMSMKPMSTSIPAMPGCLRENKRLFPRPVKIKNVIWRAHSSSTGQVVWVAEEKKNSFLFIRLLAALRTTYRRAKQITLIVDNYALSWESSLVYAFFPDSFISGSIPYYAGLVPAWGYGRFRHRCSSIHAC